MRAARGGRPPEQIAANDLPEALPALQRAPAVPVKLLAWQPDGHLHGDGIQRIERRPAGFAAGRVCHARILPPSGVLGLASVRRRRAQSRGVGLHALADRVELGLLRGGRRFHATRGAGQRAQLVAPVQVT